jgi:hypothetical protein
MLGRVTESMQLRCLHATEATFAVRDHDPAGDGHGPTIDVADSIVALVAVEGGDAEDISGVADAAAADIAEMADHLGEQTVVLVPVADLTDTPAADDTTTSVLDALADRLDGDVHRVPVADHVAVDLEARGHPHASQFFEISPPDRTGGEWFVFDDGDLVAPDEHDLLTDGHLPDRLSGDRLFPDAGPPLADDALLPLGTFVRDTLLDFVMDRFRATGAVPVDESGTLDPWKFAADDSALGLAVYAGDGTLAAAVRPDDALDTAAAHADLLTDLLDDIGLDAHPVCRLDADFFENNREQVVELADRFDDSLLVDSRSDPDQPLEVDLLVCADGHRLAEPTISLDAGDENAVVRTQLGDPTRLTAAVARAADRDTPVLPTWLSPTQLRLIPLTDDDIERCVAIADDLPSVRVDIDDRDIPVGERLGDASQQWIPYDAVIGEGDEERFGVTIRAEEREREFTTDSFAQAIDCETANFPDRRRPLPLRYTDCPARFREQ